MSNRIKKSRKLLHMKPSEEYEAYHTNRAFWRDRFHQLEANTSGENHEVQSEIYAKVLPNDVYRRVCENLGIPAISRLEHHSEAPARTQVRRSVKEPKVTYRKTLVIERELDSDTDVEISPREKSHVSKRDIFQEFLMKPEKEQVTWPSRYLQPEKEDEKTLVRKADDLTDKIVTKFCDYMKELGGDQPSQLFIPKTVKELFQIEFDTCIARSLKVDPKELPTIGEKVAIATGHMQKSRSAALERLVTGIKENTKPDRLFSFGRSLPLHEQYRAPRNDTEYMWHSTRHIPKDLVTMKTVWEGITNLRSVKEYCRWMIKHPEYRRAPYLKSLGMFDPAVLKARLTIEAQHSMIDLTNTSRDEPLRAPVEHIQ